jgi:hypothetical protein
LNELWKELNNVKKRQNVWDNMKWVDLIQLKKY